MTSNWKTYACGCKAIPADTPNYCPEHELSPDEELQLEELRNEWRFADQPHPSEDQMIQSIIERRPDAGGSNER